MKYCVFRSGIILAFPNIWVLYMQFATTLMNKHKYIKQGYTMPLLWDHLAIL